MATDRGCPECQGTLVVRFDDVEVACPFHGDAALVQVDSEASQQIRERILEHARLNPPGQLSPEPPDWRSTSADPSRSSRGLRPAAHGRRRADHRRRRRDGGALVTAQPIIFLDTETTSLGPDRRVWEFAAIRRDDQGEQERRFFVRNVDLSEADSYSLKVGGFYDRHPQYCPTDVRPAKDALDRQLLERYPAAQEIERLTRGATIVGSVPSFDTEVLGKMLRSCNLVPAWHYHLVDIKGTCCRLAPRPRRRPRAAPMVERLPRRGLRGRAAVRRRPAHRARRRPLGPPLVGHHHRPLSRGLRPRRPSRLQAGRHRHPPHRGEGTRAMTCPCCTLHNAETVCGHLDVCCDDCPVHADASYAQLLFRRDHRRRPARPRRSGNLVTTPAAVHQTSEPSRILSSRIVDRSHRPSSPCGEQRPPAVADGRAPGCRPPAPGSGPATAPRPAAGLRVTDSAASAINSPAGTGSWGVVVPAAASAPRRAGREAGKSSAIALPGRPARSLLTLSLAARVWADPSRELPALPGAGGWDVSAA